MPRIIGSRLQKLESSKRHRNENGNDLTCWYSRDGHAASEKSARFQSVVSLRHHRSRHVCHRVVTTFPYVLASLGVPRCKIISLRCRFARCIQPQNDALLVAAPSMLSSAHPPTCTMTNCCALETPSTSTCLSASCKNISLRCRFARCIHPQNDVLLVAAPSKG